MSSIMASFLTGKSLKDQKSQPATQLRPLPVPRHSPPLVVKKNPASGSHSHPYPAHGTNMSPPIFRDTEAIKKLLKIVHDTPGGGQTVARLARTCKVFKEPALDILWSELGSLLPLIRLFPEYIMKRARRPELGLVRSVYSIPHHAAEFQVSGWWWL